MRVLLLADKLSPRGGGQPRGDRDGPCGGCDMTCISSFSYLSINSDDRPCLAINPSPHKPVPLLSNTRLTGSNDRPKRFDHHLPLISIPKQTHVIRSSWMEDDLTSQMDESPSSDRIRDVGGVEE